MDPVFKFDNGDRVRDVVTQFTGVVTSRTEWLNGCIRYGVQPEILHEGKPVEAYSYDEAQLALVDAKVIAPAFANARVFTEQRTGGPYPNPKRQPDPKR